MISIFILFLLGVTFKFTNFLKPQSIRDLKKVVGTVTLPVLLFRGFSEIVFQSEFFVVIALMFTVPLLVFLVAKPLKRLLNLDSVYVPYLLGGFEMGMLGYAMFLALFGQENLPVIAVIDLGQALFIFFVLVPSLQQVTNGRSTIKDTLKSLITSPVIIAILSGLIASQINFDFGSMEILKIIGDLTVPLIMISLGYEIEFKKEGFKLAAKTVLLRKTLLIVTALIVNKFIIDGLLGLPVIFEYAVIVMFLTPPPFVVSIFMDQDDRKNLSYVTNTLSLSIIVSVIMLSALNLLLF